jgi:hypothetical protein
MRSATLRPERIVGVAPTGAAALGGLALVGLAALLLARRGSVAKTARRLVHAAPKLLEPTRAAHPVSEPRPQAPTGLPPAVRAGRRLNQASGVLAVAVLLDSAVEHYRGSFENKAMISPLVSSALSIAASLHGVADRRVSAHRARDAVYAVAGLSGFVGTGFHLYNIGKRPGGFSWLNLFYAAPIGAPMALTLSGMLGFLAERVRDNDPSETPLVLGFPAGHAVAVLAGAGILGTVGEVGLLHFRGAYHNPAMFLPVTVPPAGAALLGWCAIGRDGAPRRLTRWWLRATALLGIAGVGFHAFGVARAMGGWRNWSQNLLNGPPLPAPPSFTGLSLAGLAALRLMEEHADA